MKVVYDQKANTVSFTGVALGTPRVSSTGKSVILATEGGKIQLPIANGKSIPVRFGLNVYVDKATAQAFELIA